MPRNATIEIFYLPIAAEELEVKAAKEVVGTLKAVKQPLEKIPYQIDQPLEPILFSLVIPKLKIKEAAARTTFFLEDVTGAAQVLAEFVCVSGTAISVTAPAMQRRIIPAKDFTIEPELEGERKWTLQAETTGEVATIPANTAKCVAYIKIDGIGRQ